MKTQFHKDEMRIGEKALHSTLEWDCSWN